MPRTAAQFTEAGDPGAANLMNRLNQEEEVESYLQENSPPSFQEGGFLEEAGDGELMNQVVEATIAALLNPSDPSSAEIIQGFRDAFGDSALDELRQFVITSVDVPTRYQPPQNTGLLEELEAPQAREQIPGMPMQTGGMVNGDGDGMADDVIITADQNTPEAQKIAISSGEWVVPADVVSGLGSGNTEAGGRVLEQMQEDVRLQRTGSGEQAPQVYLPEVLPATYGKRYE